MVIASSLVLVVGAAVLVARTIHNVPAVGTPPFRSYLADASMSGVEAAARSYALRCGTAASIGFGDSIHACQRTSRGEVLSVSMFGPDASHVAVVSAGVVGLRSEDRPTAIDLFQAVVSAAVAGPDASADTAWVRAHFDQTGTSQTTLNGVTLRLTVTGSTRSLGIHPAAR
jgi:hypothetical protein